MRRTNFGGTLTPAVKGLLIANAVVFFIQYLAGPELEHTILIPIFGLTPAVICHYFWIWQPFTYLFLHGGFMHLLFNMFALWMFGSTLESVWGTKQFLKFYFITGIGAGLCNCILTPGMDIPIIGASGAIYGLLAAYAILFPNTMIYLWAIFPVKAKYLVIFFGVFELMEFARTNADTSPVAHLVHLGGMVIGVVYLRRDYLLRWGARKVKGWQSGQTQHRREKQTETADQLRSEVDDLLDKINQVGLENLTSNEKRRLRIVSEKLRQMEEE
ncbi:MAG: rhomboid family intramembrane serine protease [Candidatus Hatepunaea meridiana]|nr:rhomboid family intramembrane serine protease [Candidatus Hatepunaea meridiana]